MRSNGVEAVSPSSPNERDTIADTVYFGTPELEADTNPYGEEAAKQTSTNPYGEEAAKKPEEAAKKPEEAAKKPEEAAKKPEEAAKKTSTIPQNTRPPLPQQVRDALLRELLGRGVRRFASLSVFSIAAAWLATAIPQPGPMIIAAAFLTLFTLGTDLGAWFAQGRSADLPVLSSTRISWLSALLFMALSTDSWSVPLWLSTFALGYLSGTAAQVGLQWMPLFKPIPILPASPFTVSLTLLSLGLVPALQIVAGPLFSALNAQILPLVSWALPDLSNPLPWVAAANWLLALMTSTFLVYGTDIAQAPLVWKTPIFITALALVVWAFLAHPVQTLLFVVVAVVLAFLSLARR